MKNGISKTVQLTLVVIVSLILSACADERQPIATEEGEILTYTTDSAPDGFYIKKGEVLQPVLSAGLSRSRNQHVMSYTSYDHLVPSVEEGDEIIFISSSGNLPNSMELTYMDDLGWTVGTNFQSLSKQGNSNQTATANNNENVESLVTEITFGNYRSSLSPAKTYLEDSIQNLSQAYITDVNNQPMSSDMLTDSGFLKGLTKGAFYRFNYYYGTRYESIELMADSRVFVEQMSYPVPNYERMQDTYFRIEPPINMSNGFYVVAGHGMFYYNTNQFQGGSSGNQSNDLQLELPNDNQNDNQNNGVDESDGFNEIEPQDDINDQNLDLEPEINNTDDE